MLTSTSQTAMPCKYALSLYHVCDVCQHPDLSCWLWPHLTDSHDLAVCLWHPHAHQHIPLLSHIITQHGPRLVDLARHLQDNSSCSGSRSKSSSSTSKTSRTLHLCHVLPQPSQLTSGLLACDQPLSCVNRLAQMAQLLCFA